MATLILAAAVVALVAVVVWQNRHRLPTRRHQSPQDERTVECAVCAKTLPVSQAVVVADTFNDDDEGEMMGGTVCMVEFCPEHAPTEANQATKAKDS